MTLIALPPRLLKKADAARYCGVDPAKFARVCPVQPVDLDGSRRWDRKALDAWLDSLGRDPDSLSSEQWLEKVGGAGHGDDRAREGR